MVSKFYRDIIFSYYDEDEDAFVFELRGCRV